MNIRKQEQRRIWRILLSIQIGAGIGFVLVGLLFSNHNAETIGDLNYLTGVVLLLCSHTAEHRERIAELERREQQRFRTDTHYAGVVSDLMDSAARHDPIYVEARNRRKRIDEYAAKLRDETGVS